MPEATRFADAAPTDTVVTAYDREHAVTYLRLLDAEADGADWWEVAQVVLGLDPAVEPDRVRRLHASHLDRARWMTRKGYWGLLQSSSR